MPGTSCTHDALREKLRVINNTFASTVSGLAFVTIAIRPSPRRDAASNCRFESNEKQNLFALKS